MNEVDQQKAPGAVTHSVHPCPLMAREVARCMLLERLCDVFRPSVSRCTVSGQFGHMAEPLGTKHGDRGGESASVAG